MVELRQYLSISSDDVLSTSDTMLADSSISAVTFLPLTLLKEYAVAFLSPELFPSINQCVGLTGQSSTIKRQMASVQMVTIFCPAASAVKYSNDMVR
ncbi:hypothetical protein D3C81_1048350 [compost metagenome]